MRYGLDVSNFSGTPTLEAVRALVCSENITDLAIAAEFPDTYATWYDLAQLCNVNRRAWLVLYPDAGDYGQQVAQYAMQFLNRPPSSFWLDIEAIDGQPPHTADNIQAALNAAFNLGYPVGIYTAEAYWQSIGNPQFGRQVRLWVAHYDNIPGNFDVNFGGWLRAAGKQYAASHQSYGLTVDLDVWNE